MIDRFLQAQLACQHADYLVDKVGSVLPIAIYKEAGASKNLQMPSDDNPCYQKGVLHAPNHLNPIHENKLL